MNNLKINKLIIVAYRIPFKVDGSRLVQNSGGLVSAILSLAQQLKTTGQISKDQKISWVGYSESFFEENNNVSLSDSDFNVVPVQIDDALNEGYYGGFCNSTIWPLFHYHPFITQFEESHFTSFIEANKLFAETITSIYEEGDVIWVHDYQLMLLPEMLRRKFPKSTIGFFLHIPFPSFELFRLLPKHWEEEILRGMLGADLIGFHINDYTQHFIKSVARVLGLEHNIRDISIGQRAVRTDTFPISIDYNKFNSAFDLPEVVAVKEKVRAEQKDNKILFSVDRLDYSKGFKFRLCGYETFLENYPEWKEKVTFYMVVVPSRDSILQYQEMKYELEEAIGRINGKFGTLLWRPIVYMYNSLNFSELVGLYTVCDVALITPIRDGMNLVAKEFVASRKDQSGVLILSEMAGAASELHGSLQINPTDKNQIAASLHEALNMDDIEKKERMETMQKRIAEYDVFKWSGDFIDQLALIKNKQEKMASRLVDSRILEVMKSHYATAKTKLLLLDYDGTLVPFANDPALALPSQEVLDFLEQTANSGTEVAIVSGRNMSFMEKIFPNLPVYLSAEHGAYMKQPKEMWQSSIDPETKWKEHILSIFKNYVDRCPGTFIENKNTSVCWHYRNASLDFSFVRSRELLEELNLSVINKLNLSVLDGNKVIEVKPSGCDKGNITAKLIQKIQPDFILSIGDDVTDEDMFMALPEEAYSIKVGNKTTHAKYNILNQRQVLDLLMKITH